MRRAAILLFLLLLLLFSIACGGGPQSQSGAPSGASGTTPGSTGNGTTPASTQNGAADGAHLATLTWNASVSTGVVGYYVYRATQNGGPYTKLNPTPAAGTSYQDADVADGMTYYYVLTAANSTGAESAYSDPVSGTIP